MALIQFHPVMAGVVALWYVIVNVFYGQYY